MKSVSRTQESATPGGHPSLFGLIRKWAQSLYDMVHDPSHCAGCGVYLPAHDRICQFCARERN
jgi:hypothetical protein